MIRRPNLLTACAVALLAASPVLADHPKDMGKILPAALAGDLGPANSELLKDSQSSGRNQLLYLYELGAIHQLRGNFAKSVEFFNMADGVAREAEAKALASVSGGANQLGAALTNDTVLPWEVSCLDKVMARTMNAMNYLAMNKLEDAKVEVRKAEEYQSRERTRTQGKVNQAGGKDNNMASAGVTKNYNEMFSFVADVRNSYENAFTYYLSSHIYRAHGPDGLNDALVDMKQALALAPTSPAVQSAYLELVAQSGDAAQLQAVKTQLGVGPDWTPADPAQTGTVVVIYEPGFAPRLSEVTVDLFVGSDLFSMAFPIYRGWDNFHQPLSIRTPVGDKSTTRLVDIRKLAVKSLQERMPAILARAMVGGLGKIQAQKQAEKQLGILGKWGAKLATKLVTNADLRSWLALPAEVQVAQFALLPGPQSLAFSTLDWVDQTTVDVVAGSTTFVVVRAARGTKTITATTVKVDL